jgi:hypothetical protein
MINTQGGKNQYTKQATDNVASKMPISFNESSRSCSTFGMGKMSTPKNLNCNLLIEFYV